MYPSNPWGSGGSGGGVRGIGISSPPSSTSLPNSSYSADSRVNVGAGGSGGGDALSLLAAGSGELMICNDAVAE